MVYQKHVLSDAKEKWVKAFSLYQFSDKFLLSGSKNVANKCYLKIFPKGTKNTWEKRECIYTLTIWYIN